MMDPLTRKERQFLFNDALFFKGLPEEIIAELVDLCEVAVYAKRAVISNIGDLFEDVLIIVSGLVRVSVCSPSGRRVTFLLVKSGEPYNLIGPYLNRPRFIEARALEKTTCLRLKGKDYLRFVEMHPQIATQIIQWVGIAFDSSNSRLLDLIEKKVEDRIKRVLSTLHEKFGSPLLFTSAEISEIAGTTTESTLRAMSLLRNLDVIATDRGKIWIKNAFALRDPDFGNIKI